MCGGGTQHYYTLQQLGDEEFEIVRDSVGDTFTTPRLQFVELPYGHKTYNMTLIPSLSALTKFSIRVDVNGFAYNVLSCAVLIAYCLLVFVHIVFVLINPSSSSSFDTVSEVVSVAMQSQPTERLQHTAAGIYSTRVLSNLVRLIRTGGKRDQWS